ncbi:DUF2806 domain-containing protein [Labrys sp. ZIDIC5]|uniref:DUF2806 domain-containing protein n=1 Tax=Labrys sedimenti TaxID=3106036 RepID=UPI002ACAB9BF|nr:DUF2806 domain-containing protein [Labrys sp. ZIDIC5]MDZ5448637.1 DUF2806 domain-containing protein [Labrys sp. ZIDIC5]
MDGSEDHLSNEVSLSGEITETGVKLAAKSRFVSALDRLLGAIGDKLSLKLERGNSIERAKMQAEQQLIEAAASSAIRRMEVDQEFAQRVAENMFATAVQQQKNKDAVVQYAIEDLRQTPPSDAQNSTGPEILEPEFLDRLDTYAQGASAEEIRQKWGRVLASEVRRPGTFSRRAFRIIDEIDTQTAALFERVCKHRLGPVVPKLLIGNLSVKEVSMLTSAGLMVEPGVGQSQRFDKVKRRDDIEAWLGTFGHYGIGIEYGAEFKPNNRDLFAPFSIRDGAPNISVYILTDAGLEISTIVEDNQQSAILEFAKSLAPYVSSRPIDVLHISDDLKSYSVVEVVDTDNLDATTKQPNNDTDAGLPSS